MNEIVTFFNKFLQATKEEIRVGYTLRWNRMITFPSWPITNKNIDNLNVAYTRQ